MMSVPATTTVLIFMGGVATGIILIITILLCCRVKSRHNFFRRNRGIAKKSCSPSSRIHAEYDRGQEVPFARNEDIFRDDDIRPSRKEDVQHVEVPIINSLKEIIDGDGCPTPHVHQCNIVQIQIDSNKTFKFYSRYDTSGQNATKKQSLDFCDKISRNFCEIPENEDLLRTKTLNQVAQSVSNSLHLSPSLLKSSIIRSMPNVSVDIPICSHDNKDVDQQSRRISFRKKLHNMKKYIDESIVENICNESIRKSDENVFNKNVTKERANVQEMSKELWQLRAMLADADELESEESNASTPHNDEIQNSNEPIRNEFAWSRKIFPMDILNNGAMNLPEIKKETKTSQPFDDDAKTLIQKKPSVRRQVYRNALARQQQQIMSQESNLQSEDLTNVKPKQVNNLNSEDVESQPSCESKADDDVDGHNNRLERLRGDSGYKSLENQQSLRTSFQLIIQENDLMGEGDPSSQIFAPSSNSQVLTRRVHSADETLVAIPLSLLSVTDESFEESDNLTHQAKLADDLLIEELKVRKSSQNIDLQSQSKFRNHSTTSSHIVSIVKPIFCNSSLLSSSFASSLFSRFLRSHSRRTHTRTQRDYSIDERSDAIFNEFIRFDPTLEMRHTSSFSRTSPRSHQRLQRYKFSEKYSPIPLVSEKTGREQRTKSSEQKHLKKLNKTNSGKQTEGEVHGEQAQDVQSLTQPENLEDKKIKKISNLKNIPVIQLTEEENI